MPFVLRKPAGSPPVLRVWGWWGGGGQVQRREGPGPPAPFCPPCPGLTAPPRAAPGSAPPRAPPSAGSGQASGSRAHSVAGASNCRWEHSSGTLASNPVRQPRPPGRCRAQSPSRFCGELSPPTPFWFCPQQLGLCVLGRRPGPTPGPRAEARSLGDCWFLLAVEGTG